MSSLNLGYLKNCALSILIAIKFILIIKLIDLR